MDILSMILARNQGGDEPLASSETKTITWDGNSDNHEILDLEDIVFVKIYDEPIDNNKVTEVEVSFTGAEVGVVTHNIFQKESMEWSEEGIGKILTISLGDYVDYSVPGILMIITEDVEGWCTKGVYALLIGAFWVSKIITETIHPIDPKYIPAMDSITLNGADGKQYEVTVDANGALSVKVKGDSDSPSGEAFIVEFSDKSSYAEYTIDDIKCYKVSNKVPTLEQIPGCTMEFDLSDGYHVACSNAEYMIPRVNFKTAPAYGTLSNGLLIVLDGDDAGIYVNFKDAESRYNDYQESYGIVIDHGSISFPEASA